MSVLNKVDSTRPCCPPVEALSADDYIIEVLAVGFCVFCFMTEMPQALPGMMSAADRVINVSTYLVNSPSCPLVNMYILRGPDKTPPS